MDLKFQNYTKPRILQETEAEKKARARTLLRILKKTHPDAGMILRYSTPVQLLVAVMLSAQCTDKKVNEVTASLFKKYRSAEDFANADPRVFEREIHSTGFYRAKTKNILAAAKMLVQNFKGKLPRTMEDMLKLPGVARKTANVVLGNAYSISEGIAVDTHVSRLAQRLGLTQYIDPNKIEKDLMNLFPKKEWFKLTYRLIGHGRAICTAQRRKCEICPLNKLCPSSLV